MDGMMRFGEDVAPRPPHVPESAMRDFDLYHDPALKADPHARILELLPIVLPLFWTPRTMDPPDHGRFRAPLQRAFSPRLMLALEPRMEAMASELIDAVICASPIVSPAP